MNSPDTTRIIFLRHGQSTYNELKLYQGCCDDSLLNDTGKLQAFQSGQYLSQFPINCIYGSPLQRTQATAREVIRAIESVGQDSPRLQLHPNLKEIDLPGWQGLPFKYVREHLGAEYQIWQESPDEFISETIISSGSILLKTQTKPVLELYKQAQKFWQEVLPKHLGETILIVSHGGTIRALISTALGIEAKHFHTLQQSNCGISIVDVTHQNPNPSIENPINAQLTAVNLTQHLGEILPKLKNGKQGLRLLVLPVDEHIPTSAIEQTREFLKSVELNFCLSSDTPKIQALTESLLASHPNPPVNLHVSQENFLAQWHQFILNRQQNPNSLQTGIIIADMAIIQPTCDRILELDGKSGKLNLQHQQISIIFYPSSQTKPVIQGINIGSI